MDLTTYATASGTFDVEAYRRDHPDEEVPEGAKYIYVGPLPASVMDRARERARELADQYVGLQE